MAKAKQKQSDSFFSYAFGIGVLAVTVAGLAIVWGYFQYNARFASPVTYESFGPMIVRSPQLSIKATITIQTRNDDASWLRDNRKALDFALQTALGNVDPVLVRQPEGVTYVQAMLRNAANKMLRTDNVQEVLLTDFIVQSE